MKKKIFYENKISLEIFKKIDKLNLDFNKKFSKINLVSIFFLEIQKYLSCSFKNILYKKKYHNEIKFPFFDINYLNTNKQLFFKKGNKIKHEILDENLKDQNLIFQILKKINYRKHSIGVYFANSYINDYIKKKNLNVKKIHFEKIFLKNLNNQSEDLKKFLFIFKKKYKIKNSFYEKNFLDWINLFISHNQKSNDVNTEKLLTGSNMKIKSRIMSARYLLNKKEVISFAHANYSSLIYKDPVNECGEFCFTNKYYSNGKIKFKKKYIKSDLCLPSKIIYRNVKKRNFVKSNNIENKCLYIPNSYNSYRRYGYFRDFEDSYYIKWQRKILESSKSIYFKPHPKSRFKYNLFPESRVKCGNIADYLENFNLFIFDMISQPFFTVAETNNKILYLDIDQRILNKKVLNLIKKRACVVKCNPNEISKKNLKEIIKKAENFKIKNFKILSC